MQSMTGFGRAVFTNEDREYRIDIKTVNHKYNDINIRISRLYSWLESNVRRYVSTKLSRGKIDVNISIDNVGNKSRKIVLDEGLADLYINGYKKIKENYNIESEIDLNIISRIPDIFKIEIDEDEESIWQELKQVLDTALQNLIDMRQKEGESLKNDILSRKEVLKSILGKISDKSGVVVTEYREKLKTRINEILGNNNLDDGRLEQETALFADKCNIDEELTRLTSHINQLEHELNSENNIGKKLDFLIQEMNREINTIGSKSNDLEITKNVIEFKTELEKVREQVQNIE